MRRLIALSIAPAAIVLAMSAASPNHALGQGGIDAGVLVCRSLPATKRNLIIHSSVQVSCTFSSIDGTREKYRGKAGITFGLDLKLASNETIAYTVLTVTTDVGSGALSGTYFGAKASVEAGVGVGVAVLVGGGDHNVTLQPLALEGSRGGAGAAAGIGYLSIEPAKS